MRIRRRLALEPQRREQDENRRNDRRREREVPNDDETGAGNDASQLRRKAERAGRGSESGAA
jgi:hypothetical protein